MLIQKAMGNNMFAPLWEEGKRLRLLFGAALGNVSPE